MMSFLICNASEFNLKLQVQIWDTVLLLVLLALIAYSIVNPISDLMDKPDTGYKQLKQNW